jgi:hypothetical protein
MLDGTYDKDLRLAGHAVSFLCLYQTHVNEYLGSVPRQPFDPGTHN